MKQPGDFQLRIRQSFEESIVVKQTLLSSADTVAAIARASEAILKAFRQGKKLLLFGNGGSGADAEHIASEFVGKYGFHRPALPALSLGMSGPCLTAVGNDYGFDHTFSRQVEALGCAGDIAVGISTSGNSLNVLEALRTARGLGLHAIGLTGQRGGQLKGWPDLLCCICVPTNETPRVQECHLLIGHVICEVVEQELFGESDQISGS